MAFGRATLMFFLISFLTLLPPMPLSRHPEPREESLFAFDSRAAHLDPPRVFLFLIRPATIPLESPRH
jgi:hypothetical protein